MLSVVAAAAAVAVSAEIHMETVCFTCWHVGMDAWWEMRTSPSADSPTIGVHTTQLQHLPRQ